MTGAALNIACGQVPGLMGISSKLFDTRASTYLVIIHTLKYLGHTKLDAAMGLSALTMLYLIRFTCGYLAKRQPSPSKDVVLYRYPTIRVRAATLYLDQLLGQQEPQKQSEVQDLEACSSRFSGCRCAHHQYRNYQLLCERASSFRHRPLDRAHCNLEILWQSQQLHN